jgi:hypothetical protein
MKRDHLLGWHHADKLQEETDYIKNIARSVALVPGLRTNAAHNLERVRAFYEDHPGCTQKMAARSLNLTSTQVHFAVEKLRAEWRNK